MLNKPEERLVTDLNGQVLIKRTVDAFDHPANKFGQTTSLHQTQSNVDQVESRINNASRMAGQTLSTIQSKETGCGSNVFTGQMQKPCSSSGGGAGCKPQASHTNQIN